MTDLHRSRIIAWSLTAIGMLGIVVLLAADRNAEAVAALPPALFFGVAHYFIGRELPPAFDTSTPIVLGMGLAEFARLRRFSAPHAY